MRLQRSDLEQEKWLELEAIGKENIKRNGVNNNMPLETTEVVCVKEEPECVDNAGVSAAAALAGLYTGHDVKDELVLGPEEWHRPKVLPVHNKDPLTTTETDVMSVDSPRATPPLTSDQRHCTIALQSKVKANMQAHTDRAASQGNSSPDEVVPCDGLRCVQVLIDEGKVMSLNFMQIKHLISSPKPTPNLCISQICQSHKRKFSRAVYKTQWIVGCSHTNKLYCWCCIFFSNDSNVWNTCGYDDLNNLSGSIKRHMNSNKHLCAVISFSSFGKNRMEASLSSELSEEISIHNMRVDNNRRVFQRLVDIVCHLAQQELPFGGHEDSNTSSNRDNFLGLVSLLSKYDGVLERHFQQSDEPTAGYLSSEIQNDIIRSVADVMRTQIELEIKKTKFVSVIIDETPDVGHAERLCLVLRYFHENDIHDRFMGYVDVPVSRTADALSNIVLHVINKNDCAAKLVAQSYDGASAISGIRNEVQQKVKQLCPQAIYVWCNAHVLSFILSKSCNSIKEVSTFFSALQSLCTFFSHSTKRAAFYDIHCSKKLPNTSATRWTYMSQLVNTVFGQKHNLVTVFSEICDNPQDWDGDTIFAAENFETLLSSFNFIFFLSTFHRIVEKSDCLSTNLQQSEVGVGYCSNRINEFQSWLRDEFQTEFEQIYQNTSLIYVARLRRNVQCVKTEYKRIFVEIINNIYSVIDDRYSEMYKLKFFQLLNHKQFENYCSNFPTLALDSLFEIYADHFDKQTLKTQLIVLYSSPELRNYNVFKIIDFINENRLGDTFPELLKLANLVVTIPATSASAERAFSSLKRIHTCLRNTQGQERLSGLSTIAIEKQLLVELKRSPTFYSDVIDSFLKKDRRFELLYK